MDNQYLQSRLPLSSLLATYLRSHNSTSPPPQLFLSIPDYTTYCPSCALPRLSTDLSDQCLCSSSSTALPSYLDFSPTNNSTPVNSTFEDFQDFDISAFISTPEPSNTSTPSLSFSASTPPSPTSSNRGRLRNSSAGGCARLFKDRRRRGVMSEEEAREKRQQQNRNSQRNFRLRQAKLVESLREEIEKLKEENRRLLDEVLGRGGEQRKGSEREASGKRKRKVVKEEEEAVACDRDEDEDEDEDGGVVSP